VNFQNLADKVINIEVWRRAFVSDVNNVVVPAISKVQRRVEGIQKRVDAQNKFIGRNKCTYDNEGRQLTIMTECLRNGYESEEVLGKAGSTVQIEIF